MVKFQRFPIGKILVIMAIFVCFSGLVIHSESMAESPGPVPTMVHYWTLDELSTLSGGEGFQDLGSFSVPALVISDTSPEPMKGVFNTAQEFDLTEKINVSASDSFNWAIDEEFSIEYWVRKVGTPAENQVVIGRDEEFALTLHWWTGIHESGTAAFILFDNNQIGGGIMGSTNITDGKWHHVVALRGEDQNQQFVNKLFVDGKEEAAESFLYEADFTSQTELNIGWLSLNDPRYSFAGSMDEIALYSVALSPAEIEQHFRAGRFGDFTDDNHAGLEDVIAGLQILAGLTPDGLGSQWQNDDYAEIGLEQVIYVLQKTAGLKTIEYTEPSL